MTRVSRPAVPSSAASPRSLGCNPSSPSAPERSIYPTVERRGEWGFRGSEADHPPERGVDDRGGELLAPLADELHATHPPLHLARVGPAAAAAVHPLDPHGLLLGTGLVVSVVLGDHPQT